MCFWVHFFFFFLIFTPITMDGLTLLLAKVHLHFFAGVYPPCLPKNYFSSNFFFPTNFFSLTCIIRLPLFWMVPISVQKCYLFYILQTFSLDSSSSFAIASFLSLLIAKRLKKKKLFFSNFIPTVLSWSCSTETVSVKVTGDFCACG